MHINSKSLITINVILVATRTLVNKSFFFFNSQFNAYLPIDREILRLEKMYFPAEIEAIPLFIQDNHI